MTSGELAPASATDAAEAPASAGARLAAARVQAGMSVDDVSRQLKLAPRQVVAIERDDFASLPGRTFIRGFVRNYARLVKIDVDATLAALPAEFATAAPERAGLAPTPRPMGELPSDAHSGRSASRWAIPAVLIAIVTVAAIYEFARTPPSTTTGKSIPDRAAPPGNTEAKPAEPAPPGGPRADPATGAADSRIPPEVAAAPGPSSSASPGASSANPASPAIVTAHTTPLPNPLAGASPSAPVAAAAPASASSTPAVVIVPTPSPAPAPAAAAPAVAAVAAPGPIGRGAPSLSLVFRGTSWVEVRDRAGQVVLSMTGNDGASREVTLAPGGELVVGNVAGLDASWRGRPLDLSVHARQNVARVRLD